jgi:4-cresol dehydrogenase (hydroxylating) flavoprotein subunit
MKLNALKVWQDIVGSENVLTDSETISAVQTTTFATTQGVLAVIRPSNTTEVQACVKIANQYKIPIYPVSCGKNWGLGSRVPVQDNCVVLELSRLNQILDYNEKLAYVTVEPGVTFRQVYEYLHRQNSNLFVSVTGSSPDSSLIGNTLERGDGIGPYGNRLTHVCGFEVILPTGDMIHTGFGRFSNAKTTSVSPWGVGLYLDGIFTQSNLGIVTKMTMWLLPIPKYFQAFTCVISDTLCLEKTIDIVQKLVLQETLKSNSFSFWNSYKVLARQGQYPWLLTRGKTPLSLQDLKGGEPWYGSGALYSASQEQGLAERKIIEEALVGQVEQLTFFDSDSNKDLLKDNMFLGAPNDINIKTTYWRKKQRIPSLMNPDRDRCGVLWLCPAFPFDGNQIVDALTSIELIIKSYDFEPNIAMTCPSGRSIHMFISILFDRNNTVEEVQAIECHNQVLQFLTQNGYILYRLGIQSMNSLPLAQDDYGKFIGILKHTLDPNDILSPGRYDFRND